MLHRAMGNGKRKVCSTLVNGKNDFKKLVLFTVIFKVDLTTFVKVLKG